MSQPLRLGDESDFRTVREFLDSCGYTEEAAAERMGLAQLYDIGRYDLFDIPKRDRNLAVRDRLTTVVRLFLAGHALAAADVEAFLPPPVLRALESLGLIERQGERMFAPVLLFPLLGIYLVSDRFVNPDATPVEALPDFVYLPLQRSSRDFLLFLPNSPCDTFLDIGAGQGVAALWAARHFAKHAVGVDIAARAVHFAEFARMLNAIPNATFLEGDMYQPCAGRQFDRIVMHPPYALASTSGYIYADGGDNGETLFRRGLEGAHQHLTPGGTFFCWTTALDLKGAALEQRVRDMLGERHEDCDIAVLVDELNDPEAFALATMAARGEPAPQLQVWRQRLDAMNIRSFVYGGVTVKRHQRAGLRPVTVRRTRSARTNRGCMEWLLSWESAAAQPSRAELLMSAKPRAAEGAELHVRHQFREGSLAPIEYALHGTYPFESTLTCGAWMAYVFSRCDGSRTGAELFAEAKDVPQEHFLDGLSALVSGGFVEIESFKLPAGG